MSWRRFRVAAALGLVAALPVFAAGGEADGASLIKPAFGTIFWTVVTFLCLLFLLRKFAWGPLLGALEQRERAIQSDIDRAVTGRQEAESLLEQHKELLAQARRERAEAQAAGKRDAERIREEMLAEARGEREKLLEQTQAQIRASMDQARTEMRTAMVDLALGAAEKLLEARLDDPTQRRLVESYLADLERAGEGTRPS